ncbi:MAG: CvpA family protein [Gammaproteobacteria bacterium]|jgi:membrane protein required for colicin V production|nr:CvpA family protein [Gammaproteobacteria bacterium]MDP6616327.1 CvpA family protein [Gammaproteobacteria bacterium]MDP6695917.1 CvpA family protein [Gammaproteobacteria bacterium]MDP7042296.1 CvpA family protein [Gammaproteobacteria bacterium]
MVAIDYVLIVVLGLSTVVSLFRGFFKEALSLTTWVVALWVAWKVGPQLAGNLEPWLSTSVLRLWVARVLIVIGVLIAGGLLGWFLGIVLESTGLSGTDRSIGMVFGFARGVILAGLLVMILELLGFNETGWWYESKLIPYAAPVAEVIRHAAEDGLELLEEIESSEDFPAETGFAI